jgi:hypothetical protein
MGSDFAFAAVALPHLDAACLWRARRMLAELAQTGEAA